jgi:hypothetical protein
VSYLETRKLVLNVVIQLTETGTVPSVQRAQLALEESLIQDLTNTNTSPRSLITVARTDTLAGGADLLTTKLGLLQTVYNRVQVEANMGAVGDEYALASTLETLLLKGSQFLEETRDMHDSSGTDEVDAFWRDQTGGEDVEVVGLVTMNNGMARIWTEESIREPRKISRVRP